MDSLHYLQVCYYFPAYVSLTGEENYVVGEGEVLTVCAEFERNLNSDPAIDHASWAFTTDDDTAVLGKYDSVV